LIILLIQSTPPQFVSVWKN